MDASSLIQELHDIALRSQQEDGARLQEKVGGVIGQIDALVEKSPVEPKPSEKTASAPSVEFETRDDHLLMAGILAFAEADAIRRSASAQQRD